MIQARPGLQQVGLGVLMLAVLIWRPEGLTGGREITFPSRLPFTRTPTKPAGASEPAPELVIDKPDA